MSFLLQLAGGSPSSEIPAILDGAVGNGVSISNGGRTATNDNASMAWHSAIVGAAKSAGKYRVRFTQCSAEYAIAGITDNLSGAQANSYIGDNSTTKSWSFSSHGYKNHNNSNDFTGETFGPASVVDLLINLDDNQLTLVRDGVVGTVFDISARGATPMYVGGSVFQPGNTFTVNTGQASMGAPQPGYEDFQDGWPV